MKLIKGRKTSRRETRDEEMFRVPATEEIWEVAYVEEGEREQREAPSARKPRNLPIAS